MPNGYTAKLYEGKPQTFEEFVLSCARAFGACVMMRDDPRDRLPPERFDPDTGWHDGEIRRAEARLAELRSMSDEQAEYFAGAEYERLTSERQQEFERNAAIRKRYESMLAQADAWTPPTEDHAGLRDFMLQQIRSSLEFDCGEGWTREEIVRASGRQWREDQIAESLSSLAYHQRKRAEEIERTEQRNRWLAQLRASLEKGNRG